MRGFFSWRQTIKSIAALLGDCFWDKAAISRQPGGYCPTLNLKK